MNPLAKNCHTRNNITHYVYKIIDKIYIYLFFIFYFFLKKKKREKATPKQCPPVVIKSITNDTDHELQGSKIRGA